MALCFIEVSNVRKRDKLAYRLALKQPPPPPKKKKKKKINK